jgi:hypothetical protein
MLTKTGDALPTNTSEPELITAQNTTNISEPRSSGTHLSALQHESCEEVSKV